MRFLFVFAGPNKIGGIETLIGRMSQWLVRTGHEVSFITGEFSACRDLLPAAVSIIELKSSFEDLFLPGSARRLWQRVNLNRPDVIKSFDLPSAWAAGVLSEVIVPSPAVLCGIYNPVFLRGPRRTFRNLRVQVVEEYFVRNVPSKGRIFMATEQIESLKKLYGCSETGNLLMLPIDCDRFAGVKRSPKWGKIVSIGRIVPWKKYNLYMVDVIRHLRDRGHDVCWDIFGDGDLQDKQMLMRKIENNGLSKWITLHENLPYEKFPDALRDAYIFVGMGTSVLEASACGVPNVVALAEDDQGRTLGPIYRFPLGNTGEPLSQGEFSSVEEEIVRILMMHADEYQRESQLVRDYCQAYNQENTMPLFLEYARNSPIPYKTVRLQFLFGVSRIWISLKNSRFFKSPESRVSLN